MDEANNPPAAEAGRRQEHWRKTRKLTVILLTIWFFTGFFTVFFARELVQLNLFGWPFSFYMAAQGSSLIYLLIIGFYAWRLRRMDQEGQAGESP
ncbi:DUF4212 domain-containing protein [Janthinobacterium agaricidamnosum]|uniref:Sodium symporter small subunit domain-containing protein n=1 Tax=Janthinobacterium agaricidamnosum NBRC 102515 = DSM 9628 TaxID=1349767 RepID=W0V1F2_9BURK|nr:DUF4212 domain-containing protein [Janthinobacterium agaricidamnosum]CDG81168.1 putative uncharacterized protein [Janthinobacterium agaricidamnosum NBRC 102515 = DSM 9628]